MEQDLSTYPPTKQGTEDILRALTPAIRALWRAERVQQRTDDLVVVIDTKTKGMKMNRRSATFKQLQRHNQNTSLLRQLQTTTPGEYGPIRIWAIIGFAEGPVFIASIVLAAG